MILIGRRQEAGYKVMIALIITIVMLIMINDYHFPDEVNTAELLPF